MNEAELLFTHLLECSRRDLYLDRKRTLGRNVSAALAEALRCRMRGEPLEYILGETEFMGLGFRVTPAVLIPRPETEVLVETAERIIGQKEKEVSVLEIGTGSGCIAVSLARRCGRVRVLATDLSEASLAVARLNARRHGVTGRITFCRADLFGPRCFDRRGYDLIISNPPYIRSRDIGGLQPEIGYEPRAALDGGSDGLRFYRRIVKGLARYLAPDGAACFEIGFGQRRAIEAIVRGSRRFTVADVVKDYAMIDRVVTVICR